jgi:carboxylesterase type B
MALLVNTSFTRLQVFGNTLPRYNYKHRSSTNPWPAWTGTMHGDEIEYVFGFPVKRPQFYTVDEIDFAEDILDFWTNFVKTGQETNFYIFLSIL